MMDKLMDRIIVLENEQLNLKDELNVAEVAIHNKDKRIAKLEAEKDGQENAAIYWHGNYNNLEEAKDKRIEELENDNSNAKALIGDLIQAALNDCVESLEWNEVEERVRVFLGDISEEREDD